MTMIDTLYDNHYKSREKLAWEFAKILNQEAKELEAAGVDIIQFDEPAFNVFFDEVNDWGIAALERAIEGLKCETAVHICYGYGIKANTDWKKTLGSEWRQYEEAFPRLQTSNIDIISLECHNSRVPMDLLELIRGKKVMVGAIDVATRRLRRRKRSPVRYVKRLSLSMPISFILRPTAGWRPCLVRSPEASSMR
jgi:5-methyltetrahydropteroyltriglutamate--homocysteine methyltransferase